MRTPINLTQFFASGFEAKRPEQASRIGVAEENGRIIGIAVLFDSHVISSGVQAVFDGELVHYCKDDCWSLHKRGHGQISTRWLSDAERGTLLEERAVRS